MQDEFSEARRMAAYNREWERRCIEAGDLAAAGDKAARAAWWDARAEHLAASIGGERSA